MIQNLPLIQLDAVDCDLHYICPQISRKQKYSDFVLNIRQNEALKKLSFFPKTVLPFPDSKAKGEEIDNFPEPEFYSKDWLELNWENTSETIEASYNIQIFGEEGYCGSSREKKLNFKEAETTEENYFCKCCANCGKGAEEKIVEQLITMDICLFQITKKGIEKWNPETWRSQIKTRLCEECKEWYKNEAKKIYVPSKRKPYKRKLENQQGESEQQNQIVEVTTAVLSQDCTSSLPPSSNHSYPCEYSQPSTSAFGQLVSSNVSAPQQNMEYIYYESDVPSFNYEIHHTTDASINNGNFGDFHLIPAHSNPTDYYYSLYPSSDVYGQHLNQNYVLPHENQQVPFFGFSSTSQTTSTNMFQQSHGATSNYFTHLNSAPGLDETFVENDVLKKKK
uniref:Uncharacterized protein n=1 Tax=Panagrolaimus sp. ES5 TaxID=591445 RepID=A0AC34F9S8_9BILA